MSAPRATTSLVEERSAPSARLSRDFRYSNRRRLVQELLLSRPAAGRDRVRDHLLPLADRRHDIAHGERPSASNFATGRLSGGVEIRVTIAVLAIVCVLAKDWRDASIVTVSDEIPVTAKTGRAQPELELPHSCGRSRALKFTNPQSSSDTCCVRRFLAMGEVMVRAFYSAS